MTAPLPTRPLALAAALLLLGACATPGQEEDLFKDPLVVQAFGLEYEDLERPGLLRGLFGAGATQPTEAAPRATAAAEGPLRPAVGLRIDGPGAERLAAALSRAAAQQPLLLLSPAATAQALAEAGCGSGPEAACAEALAVYPGLRLVLALRLAEDGSISWRSLDTALGALGPQRRLPAAETLDALAAEILGSALAEAAIAPWQARVFSAEGGVLAINAGRAHGLREGALLAVTEPGQVLRGPAGQPAGYLPGERVGTVRVVALAGERVATVEVVEGEPPEPSHRLIAP